MEKQRAKRTRPMTPTHANSLPAQLRILQVAGGDAMVAEQLRTIIWQEYTDADLPFGSSEEGMYRWLEGLLQGTDQ